MFEQQSLVERLVNQHLRSIEALHEVGAVFADEIGRMLHERDEQNLQFLAAQRSLNKARDQLLL